MTVKTELYDPKAKDLRDEFAMRAMSYFMSDSQRGEEAARKCYAMADAMLAEKQKVRKP